mmetsp:Transcript_46590/g.74138  ORF Transcript_46590/g.74138 Transcript_46590/m.74138 type:complete len:108 (-) Transcript_46590:723-1046(-)
MKTVLAVPGSIAPRFEKVGAGASEPNASAHLAASARACAKSAKWMQVMDSCEVGNGWGMIPSPPEGSGVNTHDDVTLWVRWPKVAQAKDILAHSIQARLVGKEPEQS